MSRVVKRVGKTLTKLVTPFSKQITKAVKTLWKNKIVRYVVIAAAAYFTAGAALGAIGTIGTSTSLASGAMSGLGSAWGGLQAAGSALMSGNLAGAASSLGSGLSSAAAAGAQGVGFSAAASTVSTGGSFAASVAPSAANVAATQAAPAAMPNAVVPGMQSTATAVHAGAGDVVATAAQGAAGTGAAGTGVIGKSIGGKALEFLGSQGGGMLASTGLKLAGGLIADNAAAKQRQQEIDRINSNQNVSGLNVNLGSNVNSSAFMPSGMVQVPEFDPASAFAGGQQQPPGTAPKQPIRQPLQAQQQPTGIFGARFAF